MDIFIDIETLPTSNAYEIGKITQEICDDVNRKIEELPGKYAKDETIAKHALALEQGKYEKIKEVLNGTALDGAFGELLAIGVAFDDCPGVVLYRMPKESETSLLMKLDALIPFETESAMHWIGHNVLWDMRFLWHRSIANKVTMSRIDPDFIQYTDTMLKWAGRGNRISLDKLCRALSIESPKGDMDGSKVLEAYRDERHDEIKKYCLADVEAARQIYRRMAPALVPLSRG